MNIYRHHHFSNTKSTAGHRLHPVPSTAGDVQPPASNKIPPSGPARIGIQFDSLLKFSENF